MVIKISPGRDNTPQVLTGSSDNPKFKVVAVKADSMAITPKPMQKFTSSTKLGSDTQYWKQPSNKMHIKMQITAFEQPSGFLYEIATSKLPTPRKALQPVSSKQTTKTKAAVNGALVQSSNPIATAAQIKPTKKNGIGINPGVDGPKTTIAGREKITPKLVQLKNDAKNCLIKNQIYKRGDNP